MQECFWWPGMTRDLRNRIKKCGHCRKYEAAPPVVPMKPLACSGPGELLHVDFISIEEMVPLKEDPVICNMLVLQDHFSKYVVAYLVKDQTARTAAETVRIGYFGLFGTPAYLVSDQGKAFTGHIISYLCELYGVQKLRTLPYHAQTNGQVERINQTIIRMIGKLEEDRKACWSEHLPELLMAYNATCSAVTDYSPYYLLFGRRPRIPVEEGEGKNAFSGLKRVSNKSPKMKRAPYLNPDAFHRFIGPKNLGKALVDDELVTCLLDNKAQLNFITPAYAQEWGMDIMSLEYLAEEIGGAIPHISGIGGISVEPVGFVMMNVKVPGIAGYDEDQTAIVMDDPGMTEWLVILGTPTIYRVMEVIKESEISKLAMPWASS